MCVPPFFLLFLREWKTEFWVGVAMFKVSGCPVAINDNLLIKY